IPETIPNPVVVPSQHLLRQNPPPRSQFGSRRGCPAQHELPAARDGAGNPIEVVGAWSDVTARKQLAEALAAAPERLVHLLSCDIEREPAGVAQLAAAGSSHDRHEIAERPGTSPSNQCPRTHLCRSRSSNAKRLEGPNSARFFEVLAHLSNGYRGN